MSDTRPHPFLAEIETRRILVDFMRKRVPGPYVDDLVQTVLISALESTSAPQEKGELKGWLLGIARHKVLDHYRRSGKEAPLDHFEFTSAPSPIEERLMVEWVENQADKDQDAGRTLEWMAREGEGEKLEHIAAEEKLPPTRVRQRVSRMRSRLRKRWAAELALVAAVLVAALIVWRLEKKPNQELVVTPSATPIEPREYVQDMRKQALRDCDERAYQLCLKGLDRAKELDPAGDSTPEVQGARTRAEKALREQPKDAPVPTPTANAPTPADVQSATPSAAPAPHAEVTGTPTGPNLSSDLIPTPASAGPTKPAPLPPPMVKTPVGPKQAPDKKSSSFSTGVVDLDAPSTPGGTPAGKPTGSK